MTALERRRDGAPDLVALPALAAEDAERGLRAEQEGLAAARLDGADDLLRVRDPSREQHRDDALLFDEKVVRSRRCHDGRGPEIRAAESVGDGLDRRPAPVGLLLEAAAHDLDERARHGRLELSYGNERFHEDREERRVGRAAVEGWAPREHRVEHGPERPHVGACVRRTLAHGLLGRQVGRCPQHGAGRRQVGSLQHARDPEVEHLHGAVVTDEDVPGLEVAVHDAARVGRTEPRAGAERDLHGLLDREGTAPEPLLEALAVQELEGDVRPGLTRARVEYADDVGVIDADRGLALEPFGEPFGVGRPEGLERDLGAVLGLGAIDDAHPAAAEDPLHAVAPHADEAESRVVEHPCPRA